MSCLDFVQWSLLKSNDNFFRSFPLYHWMWICPAFWGGLLSYIFAALPTPIPGQNEWITAVHTQGVQDSETFFLLFVLSTLGMASGLSLGPELPLVVSLSDVGTFRASILCGLALIAHFSSVDCWNDWKLAWNSMQTDCFASQSDEYHGGKFEV